tara:strand:- start:2566 stop:3723 length:1158 start_codon:yes stop_codon:yes gene_type:complete
MLNVITTLENQDWLADKNVQKIMQFLQTDEVEPIALFVGGVVRNALLGLPVTDIDIASKLTPEEVTKKLEIHGVKVIPTGIDHGTVTAVLNHNVFEITTLRKDVKTDGRHAEVVFTKNWAEDALRRDFTMNTLLMDGQGNVYDPTGQGVDDAKAGRVVFVGNPDQRIREDYLRILRFFRFHAYYGKNHASDLALEACERYASKIDGLSKERVTVEMLKILDADKVYETLNMMADYNVLPVFKPRNANLLEKAMVAGALTRLAAVVDLDKEVLGTLTNHLRLSNAQQKYLEQLLNACSTYQETDQQSLLEVLYYYDKDIAKSYYILKADAISEKTWAWIETVEKPVFPVSGEDLMQQGYEQGEALGKKLKELETEWVKSGFSVESV